MNHALWIKTDKTQTINLSFVTRVFVARDARLGDSLTFQLADGTSVTGVRSISWVERCVVIDELAEEMT